MAILRTDIEKALDELIAHEEGMRFQELAVVLAKQKWPELIASQWHNDGGLDGYAPASVAEGRKAKGVASSITATLGKIKGDATKTKTSFPDLEVLIFATPKKVTNPTIKDWTEEIKKLDLELVVMPREEIITSLMMPQNVTLCRSILGIHVALEPDDVELIARVREAVTEGARNWRAHPRMVNRPIVPLRAEKLDADGKASSEIMDTDSLREALAQARRIALEAPGGGGKTTTLVQLATEPQSDGTLTFLVDLPGFYRATISWNSSRARVLFVRATSARLISLDLKRANIFRSC